MPEYVGKSPSANGPAVWEIGMLTMTGDVSTQPHAEAATWDKYSKVLFKAMLKVTQY